MLRPPRLLLIAAPAAVLAALTVGACSGSSGGGSGAPAIDEGWVASCQQPLPPGQGVASATRFQTADEGLAEMDRLLEDSDLQGASGVFFTQVHDLTHDIDGQLRSADPEAAGELCAVIGQMESDFAAGGEAGSMKALAGRARELMREASGRLGYTE